MVFPGFKPDKKFEEKFCLPPKKIWEKFELEFQVCLYVLYIFPSPSGETKEKFLPSRRVGYSLLSDYKKITEKV